MVLLGLAVAYIVIFGIAETLYGKYHISAEHTRKLVHLGSGLLALCFPILFVSYVPVMKLCGSFLALLLLSKQYGFLKSINAVKRKTRGAELFPITVFTCFVAQATEGDSSYYYLPLLILALADPIAAYFGKKWPLGAYVINGHKKTVTGSLAFFATSLFICLTFYHTNEVSFDSILVLAFLIATASTISEGLVKNGYDNISIPLSVLFILHLSKTAPLC